MLASRSHITQLLCESLTPPRLVEHQLNAINRRLEKAARQRKDHIRYKVPRDVHGFGIFNRRSLCDQLITILKAGKYDVTEAEDCVLIVGFAPTPELVRAAPVVCYHRVQPRPKI